VTRDRRIERNNTVIGSDGVRLSRSTATDVRGTK
jgi:hypothetical protein